MKKGKITVLKTTLDQALAEVYGASGLCPVIFLPEATDKSRQPGFIPVR